MKTKIECLDGIVRAYDENGEDVTTLADACAAYAQDAVKDYDPAEFTLQQFLAVEFDGDAWEEHQRLAQRFHCSDDEAYDCLRNALTTAFN